MSSTKPDPRTAEDDLLPERAPAMPAADEPLQSIGRYEILGVLGQGGFGTVFQGRDPVLCRAVAVKVSRQSFSSARFLREIQAVASLQHANIVHIHEAGEEKGKTYLAMELIEGKDLAAIVRERGRLALTEALDFAIQAAQGLAYAHEHYVLHGNVTPANLLIDNLARVKIVDFASVSQFVPDGDQDDLSVVGTIFGTPGYMAPEQAARVRNIGPAVDVYSLGCTLFFAATGRQIASGRTTEELFLWHQNAQAPRLSTIVHETPPALDALLLQMLAKRPEERPTMRDVAQRLDAIRHELAGYRGDGDDLSSAHPSEIQTKEAPSGTLPSADISIGLSLAVSILAALIISMLTWNITAFLVLVGTMTAIHAACWLFVEGFKGTRSVGFKIAVFMAGFFLLWEVMQLLMTVIH
jgi:serine/threonine protein kinase